MNLTEFINTYKSKRVEYDNVSYYQCVDLVKMYAKKVLGLHFGAFGNAKDYYYGYNNQPVLKDNFKRIANTATFIPQRGDIVVWKSGINGHIAIATGEGTTKWFNSFDQNYGKILKTQKCRIVRHDYKNVLGVLRPYNQNAIYGIVPSNDFLKYASHVQNIGWQGEKKDFEISGTVGDGLRIEAIVINSNVPLQYRVHIQDLGWQDWRSNGCEAGTTGKSLRIEALQIISQKEMVGQAHVQNKGWLPEEKGTDIMLGTVGKELRLEAFRLKFA